MPTKTDSSMFAVKVKLRELAVRRLGLDSVKVLDAYHGTGRVWSRVRSRMPDIEFTVVGIDTRNVSPHVIVGDNRKILPTLDLQAFDLIDLDAYGIPAEQLSMVAERAPGTPVVVTAISRHDTPVSMHVLNALSIPVEWAKTSQVAMSRAMYSLWDDYCYRLGYRTTIRKFSTSGMRKLYEVLDYH